MICSRNPDPSLLQAARIPPSVPRFRGDRDGNERLGSHSQNKKKQLNQQLWTLGPIGTIIPALHDGRERKRNKKKRRVKNIAKPRVHHVRRNLSSLPSLSSKVIDFIRDALLFPSLKGPIARHLGRKGDFPRTPPADRALRHGRTPSFGVTVFKCISPYPTRRLTRARDPWPISAIVCGSSAIVSCDSKTLVAQGLAIVASVFRARITLRKDFEGNEYHFPLRDERKLSLLSFLLFSLWKTIAQTIAELPQTIARLVGLWLHRLLIAWNALSDGVGITDGIRLMVIARAPPPGGKGPYRRATAYGRRTARDPVSLTLRNVGLTRLTPLTLAVNATSNGCAPSSARFVCFD